jgi:hypothetical protein
MTGFLVFLQSVPPQGGFSVDDFRTMLMTLITAGILALLALNWRLRDNVRELMTTVGTSDKKGSLAHRMDDHEGRIDKIEVRNLGIDIVMKQFVRDMKNMPSGGGQRASDKALYEAVEIAFSDTPVTGK